MSQPTSPPFFLVGAVRSGTTVLRLLLGHHPKICRCDEFEYVVSQLVGRDSWPDVPAYVEWLARRRDFRETGHVADPALPFPELARDLLAQYQREDGKPVLGATVHNHFDELTRLWPDAKFIHLDRDPRDVARSVVELGWEGNVWAGVDTWIASHDAWKAVCAQVPPERRLEVRFEDFIANTVPQLERITEFLGVEYDPAMLEIEGDTTYKRPSPRESRSWRNDASELDVRAMEARLGPRLAESGYPPSGLPPLELSPSRQRRLRLDNRLGRLRFMMNRYGTSLWLRSVVARRFKLAGLRDRTQVEIDRIDERFLK